MTTYNDWCEFLLKQHVTYWSDDDLVRVLTDRYGPSKIPPCRACGWKGEDDVVMELIARFQKKDK